MSVVDEIRHELEHSASFDIMPVERAWFLEKLDAMANIETIEKTFHDADIKNLFPNGKEMIAGRAGKVLVPISCTFVSDATATFYTVDPNTTLYLATEIDYTNLMHLDHIEDIIGDPSHKIFGVMAPWEVASGNFANQPTVLGRGLLLYVGAAITGGNIANTLDVTLSFMEV
jgi:hypothetical protein